MAEAWHDPKERLDKELSKWAASLSEEEVDAIRAYRQLAYVPVNRLLRELDEPESYSESELERFDGIIEALDSAGEKVLLEEPVLVFRGVTQLASISPEDPLETPTASASLLCA